MKNLKITKGEWVANYNGHFFDIKPKGSVQSFAMVMLNECIDVGSEEQEANAQLIADAGTTANKCGKLPSELLAERDELLDVLESIVQMQKDNYGSGISTHLDLKTLCIEAQKVISKTLSK